MSGETQRLLLLLQVRGQLFVNSLRRPNRGIELAVQGLGMFSAGLLVLALAAGVFAGTLTALRNSQLWILGLLLWAIFLVWQFATILIEGYSPGINFREIARYPVSFGGYYLLNCIYGLADPAAAAGTLWLLCMWIAILVRAPKWAPAAAGVLLVFMVFNIFCNRLIAGLLERFQSTRQGRERMAVVLLLIMLAPQMIQFAGMNWHHAPGTLSVRSAVLRVAALNDLSPPGAALQAITGSGNTRIFAVLLLLGFLFISGLILRRQCMSVYLGELQSDEQRRRRDTKVSPGWKVPLLDETVSTVFEKEFRYLRQNTRLLVQIVYPMIIFAVFFSGHGPVQKLFSSAQSSSAGLLGTMAGFMALSVANICYNNFGLDRDGFGRWLLAPVEMQKVLFAKNIAHASPFLLMYALICGLLLAGGRVSPLSAATVTVSFLTVLLVQVGAGNLFSAYWPKPIDLTRMSSRTVSAAAGYAALLVIAPVGILGGLVAMTAIYLSLPWLPLVAATVIFCGVLRLYFVALDRAAFYIDHHLEEIEQALSK